jgi:hypothetical protein
MTIICDIGYTGEPRIGPGGEGEDGTFGRACSLPDGMTLAEPERIVTGCERNESGKDQT